MKNDMNTNNRNYYPGPELIGFFILMLIVVCLCSHKAAAQSSIYLLHQPTDLGIGIRVDIDPLQFTKSGRKKCGLYSSLSYGNWGLYRQYGLEHHVKTTVGCLIPLKPYKSHHYSLSFGTSYHHLGKNSVRDPELNQKLYKTWGYEIGISFKTKFLALCISTDIPRWEPCVGVGMVF